MVRGGEPTVPQLARVCKEMVNQWGDLRVYFGTARPTLMAEVQSVAPIETQVFTDSMTRPKFAVLSFLLSLRKYWFIELLVFGLSDWCLICVCVLWFCCV